MSKIAYEEIQAMFPHGIPMALMKVLFPERSSPLTIEEARELCTAFSHQQPDMSNENMFGKIRGRFDELKAIEAQRSLTDQMIGAFHAMPLGMRMEAIKRFNEVFTHPHLDVRFKISSEGR